MTNRVLIRLLHRWGNKDLAMRGEQTQRNRVIGKHVLSWLLVWCIYAGSVWTTVAYARCYTAEESDGLMYDWGSSIAISFLFTEPVHSPSSSPILHPILFLLPSPPSFSPVVNTVRVPTALERAYTRSCLHALMLTRVHTCADPMSFDCDDAMHIQANSGTGLP